MRLFSTEAVSKYHPDKYADQVSDAILTECLRQDKNSHCGIETLVKNNTVVLAGEITTSALLDYNNIVERVARKLGYPVFNIINLIGMGVPGYVLTDNMKSVVLHRDLEGHPVWQKDYEAFMRTVGFDTKLCKPRHPFTKGAVERLVRFVKENFLADRVFCNVTDLNWQALEWCNTQNGITNAERKTHRFIDGLNNYISNLDFQEICDSCNSDNPEFAREALRQMHEIFVDIYGEEPLVRDDYDFVDMPAVIRGQDGKMCLGIVCLDISSSGEHWGTTFFTPNGIIEQGNQMSAAEQKYIRQFSPYSYWYTPEVEGDIHVDFDETPDDVASILGCCRELNATEAQMLS